MCISMFGAFFSACKGRRREGGGEAEEQREGRREESLVCFEMIRVNSLHLSLRSCLLLLALGAFPLLALPHL